VAFSRIQVHRLPCGNRCGGEKARVVTQRSQQPEQEFGRVKGKSLTDQGTIEADILQVAPMLISIKNRDVH
jgi:hypothetical protein